MRNLIFAEDVDNAIQDFVMCNDGDEATFDFLMMIGAELLDITPDEMQHRVMN